MKHHRNLLSILAVALLFAMAANAQTYTPLYTYPQNNRGNTGILPPDAMSQGQDGTLYSTDAYNGAHNLGSVFKMTTAGVPTTIYSFCPQTGCLDGTNPMGGVGLGFDGNLYGTTQGGGKHAAGTVFKVTPTGTLTTLWTFANGTDDSVPIFPLLQAQDGNLYGVSLAQYNGQYGAFFKVSSTGVFSVLHDFSATDGTNPNLPTWSTDRSEEHTSELQSQFHLVCRLLLEKKKNTAATSVAQVDDVLVPVAALDEHLGQVLDVRLVDALFFFFNDTATTEIYTISLHDALPISTPTAMRGSTAFTSAAPATAPRTWARRSEEHTSELQSQFHLVCRLLLEKK